ncbi:aspartate/glutamate racemase family protein [Coprothermobacter platensis]|uniref:aspartate/glutamate racemase family protein n=1 Tax=Coprothermobacter platensis TaxID=108819 RepID=UPI0003A72AF4|nr:amino acid racemase [Coprothermobacter platensis]
MDKKIVGVIGGMGPEATIDLLRKIIRCSNARSDQEHVHLIIDDNTDIPDRTAFLMGKGENPLPFILRSAMLLQNAGVDAICMACNTAHYFEKEIKTFIQVPFISIVNSTITSLQEHFPPPQRIGIAGTKGVFLANLYGNLLMQSGYMVVCPPEQVQNMLMDVIYGIKGGNVRGVINEAETLFEWYKRRSDVVLLACTELPILLDYLTIDVPIIDTTLSLAQAIVSFCEAT